MDRCKPGDVSVFYDSPSSLYDSGTASAFDGKLDASWAPVRGADSYQIQVSVDPVTPTSWALFDSCNTASLTLEGFTSGTKQWVRVRAVGADNGKGPWSDPAVKTVP